MNSLYCLTFSIHSHILPTLSHSLYTLTFSPHSHSLYTLTFSLHSHILLLFKTALFLPTLSSTSNFPFLFTLIFLSISQLSEKCSISCPQYRTWFNRRLLYQQYLRRNSLLNSVLPFSSRHFSTTLLYHVFSIYLWQQCTASSSIYFGIIFFPIKEKSYGTWKRKM
jgi:hypothetical protein